MWLSMQEITKGVILAEELAFLYVKSEYTSRDKQFSKEIQKGNETRQFSPYMEGGSQK